MTLTFVDKFLRSHFYCIPFSPTDQRHQVFLCEVVSLLRGCGLKLTSRETDCSCTASLIIHFETKDSLYILFLLPSLLKATSCGMAFKNVWKQGMMFTERKLEANFHSCLLFWKTSIIPLGVSQFPFSLWKLNCTKNYPSTPYVQSFFFSFGKDHSNHFVESQLCSVTKESLRFLPWDPHHSLFLTGNIRQILILKCKCCVDALLLNSESSIPLWRVYLTCSSDTTFITVCSVTERSCVLHFTWLPPCSKGIGNCWQSKGFGFKDRAWFHLQIQRESPFATKAAEEKEQGFWSSETGKK